MKKFLFILSALLAGAIAWVVGLIRYAERQQAKSIERLNAIFGDRPTTECPECGSEVHFNTFNFCTNEECKWFSDVHLSDGTIIRNPVNN